MLGSIKTPRGGGPDMKGLENKVSAVEGKLKSVESSGKVLKAYSDSKNDALETKLNGYIQKLVKQTGDQLGKAKKYIDKLETEDKKRTDTQKKKVDLSDKKIESLKKMMDEMEKRHVKLVDTTIKNYDRLIRKVIQQEVAKVSKGKR